MIQSGSFAIAILSCTQIYTRSDSVHLGTCFCLVSDCDPNTGLKIIGQAVRNDDRVLSFTIGSNGNIPITSGLVHFRLRLQAGATQACFVAWSKVAVRVVD